MTHTAAVFVDLSHTITDGMVTYPGIPGPVISDHLTREASRSAYAPGTEFHIAKIELVANTGTYLDAPSHRWADGADLSGLPLERLAGLPLVVVGCDQQANGPETFDGVDVAGRAVLCRTGWSRHWGTAAYLDGHPYLTGDAAALLVERGAALVGIDSLNIDGTITGERPVHSQLLRAGIPIVEHLTNLDQLDGAGPFELYAVPVKVEGMGTFPVRAFARSVSNT
ncbi:MAG: cyclase family protein [Actinomycetota bacterium]